MSTSVENVPIKNEADPPYELLVGHYRTDDTYKTDEQLRMEYIQLTDGIIHQITSGVEIENDDHEIENQPYDTVIFLDKSARPVAWLMKELWEKLATDKDGNTPDIPNIRFLNIDREQWVNTVDPLGVGMMDIDKVDDSIIRSLRSIFIPPNQKKDGLTPKLDTTESALDNKNVLVVDEVISSGRTLDIATKMLQRAFPTAHIQGTHWMGGLTAKNGGRSVGNADLPVWYKKNDPLGRGVDNRLRDPSDSSSGNLTQRLGRWFLSTRFTDPDQKSIQLRTELHHLAHDADIPIRPSLDREEDDYFERVERLNGKPFEVAQAEIIRIAKQQ